MIRRRCEVFVGAPDQFRGWWNPWTMSRSDAESSCDQTPFLVFDMLRLTVRAWSEFSHPTTLTGKLTQALCIVTVAIISFEGRCKYR